MNNKTSKKRKELIIVSHPDDEVLRNLDDIYQKFKNYEKEKSLKSNLTGLAYTLHHQNLMKW